MNALAPINNIFIEVLYKDIKYIKRSKYLVQNTSKYISNVLELTPLHDLSLTILYIKHAKKLLSSDLPTVSKKPTNKEKENIF